MPGSLGDKLRELRGSMSLREASRKTGLSHTYISQLESGIDPRSGKEIFPSLPVLEQIADGYGIPREELLIIVGYLKSPNEIKNDKGPIDNSVKKSDNSTHTDKSSGGFAGYGDEFIPTGVIHVPIVAEISCGEPIFTEDTILGYVPMGTALLPSGDVNDYVFLRASGDSMIDADIKDGSFVLIKKQNTADNGDIVAVCVNNETATIKRIHFNGEYVVLSAENRDYMPMTYLAREVRVVGKAIMVTKAL